MEQVSIHKKSRTEIKSIVDGWKRLLSSYYGRYLSKNEKEHCEALKSGIKRYEVMLNSTDEEYIYEFQGKMVNDILPQVMKF